MSSTTLRVPRSTAAADPTAPTTGGSRPWRTVLVVAGMLVGQMVLVERLGGEELLSLIKDLVGREFNRKELLTAVLALALVGQHCVRQRPDLYRQAGLSGIRVALQWTSWLALLVMLAARAGGLAQETIGPTATDMLAGILAVGWIASPLILLPAGSGTLVAAALSTLGLLVGVFFVTDVFWQATVGTTLDLVAWLVGPFAGAPVLRAGEATIGTQDFAVEVSSYCSGIQGVILVAVLLAGYLWWFRRFHRFPQALLVIPLAAGLMYLANAVRIAALLLVGIWISPQIAVDGFHSHAGWIAFLAVGFGGIWMISRVRLFRSDLAASTWTEGESAGAVASAAPAAPRPVIDAAAACGPSVAACLAPFLALLATTILTGAFSTHGSLDLFYPLRVIAVGATLWIFRGELHSQLAGVSPLAMLIGAATCVVWMALAPAITAADPEAAAAVDPMQLGPVWGPAWLAVRLIGYTITVPIAEELAFRGFLARRLVSEQVERVPVGTFTWLSFVGSSLAFGALHGVAWIPGAIAGAAFALALYHRRRLVDAIVAHATTNALLAAYAVTTGSWNALG